MANEVKKLHDADLDNMELITLAEMANMAGEQAEDGMKRAVIKAADAGRYLEAAKRQVKHGEWLNWLGANWNYSQQTASEFIQISNYGRARNLNDVASCRDAMRLIYAEKAAKKAETGAKVEVIEPVKDDDPAPEKPTNRKNSEATRKKAEDEKPKTPPLTPEILDAADEVDPVEDWISCRSLEDVALRWLGEMPDAVALKSAAKHLRKLADKLDPPTKFVKPDAEDVAAYFVELKSADADSFYDFYESKGWVVGKVGMKDWRASARKWVRENDANGKANENGHRKNGPQNIGSNGRPAVERAKVNYK